VESLLFFSSAVLSLKDIRRTPFSRNTYRYVPDRDRMSRAETAAVSLRFARGVVMNPL